MKEDKDYYQGGGNGKTVKLYSYDADGKRSVYDNYDKLEWCRIIETTIQELTGRNNWRKLSRKILLALILPAFASIGVGYNTENNTAILIDLLIIALENIVLSFDIVM